MEIALCRPGHWMACWPIAAHLQVVQTITTDRDDDPGQPALPWRRRCHEAGMTLRVQRSMPEWRTPGLARDVQTFRNSNVQISEPREASTSVRA